MKCKFDILDFLLIEFKLISHIMIDQELLSSCFFSKCKGIVLFVSGPCLGVLSKYPYELLLGFIVLSFRKLCQTTSEFHYVHNCVIY